MNKDLQSENEMQDDELYALLDSAMADDRLCVSEDLIQRTLQRVKEEEKVVPMVPRKRKYRALVQYAGMAAAALLIVFVGSNAIKGGNKRAEDMEAPRAEATKSGDGGKYYYSTADAADDRSVPKTESEMTDRGNTMTRDEMATSQNVSESPKERDGDVPADVAEDSYMGSEEMILSDEFYGFLKKGGYEPEGKTAECWKYAGEAADTEERMEKALLTVAVINGRDTIGSYRYTVLDSRGEEHVIVSELPLDSIIRIRTDRGDLWFLLGAETMIYSE